MGMMANWEEQLYPRLPISVQNWACTLRSSSQYRLRCTAANRTNF
jgi:hypothetical protein